MAIKARSVPSAEYQAGVSKWTGKLFKIVEEIITSGNLKSRFDIFERDAIELGDGVETTIVLASDGQDYSGNDPATNNKYSEHAYYKANTINIVSTAKKPRQYAKTVKDSEIAKTVNSREKLIRLAEEYISSLYQGWIDDKNKYVAAALAELATNATTVNVPIGTDNKTYALALLAQIRAVVADLEEGVTGTSYGNNEIGTKSIAAEQVVVIINPATKALLEVYGLADAFNRDDRNPSVTWLVSNKVAENTAIITDSRNIVLRKRWDKLVEIPNSDGSINYFYNVDYFIDLQVTNSTTKSPAFPVKVIKGTETS